MFHPTFAYPYVDVPMLPLLRAAECDEQADVGERPAAPPLAVALFALGGFALVTMAGLVLFVGLIAGAAGEHPSPGAPLNQMADSGHLSR